MSVTDINKCVGAIGPAAVGATGPAAVGATGPALVGPVAGKVMVGQVTGQAVVGPVAGRTKLRLPRGVAFWWVAVSYFSLMVAASTPSPIYPVYQAKWAFPTSTLTEIFGVYALVLLLTLLTVGGLSDFLGRKPVLLGSLGLLAASMIIFACAQGVAWLFGARILQGLAAGASIGALSAGMIELAPRGRERLASVLNALIPPAGLAVGALGAGALVQYGPAPTVFIYLLLATWFVLLLAVLVVLPETEARRPGALRSLVPRVRVAAAARPAFLRAVPALFAPWAQLGLTLSLTSSLAVVTFGVHDRFTGCLLLAAPCVAAAVTGYLTRSVGGRASTVLGCLVLVPGSVITLVSLHPASGILFAVGSLVIGVGVGASLGGSIKTLTPLPAPAERGEFFAAVYVVGYLAFSVPAIAAGFAATHFGLVPTATVYGIGILVLAVVALGSSIRSNRVSAAR